MRSPRSLPKPPNEQDQEEESDTPEWAHAQEHSEINGEEQSGGESMLSPAAAASERWNSRHMSAISDTSSQSEHGNQPFVHSISDISSDSTPGSPSMNRSVSKSSTLERSHTPQAEDFPLPSSRAASSLASSQAPSPRRLRPAFLSSRQASQRSSRSTATITSSFSGSDTTVGADYALPKAGVRFALRTF
jgi:hypothetical protein